MMHDYKKGTVQPKAIRQPPYTVEVKGHPRVDGETVPRRNIRTADQLKTRPHEDIATVLDILKYASARYGNAKAMGSRKVIKNHHESKKMKRMVDGKEEEYDKQWTFSELGPYCYTTFTEHHQRALHLGSGLRKLGMKPGDKVSIYAATSPYWLSMAHGAASQSMPIVTAYDTLGEEGLTHSLCQTNAKAIFLDPSLLPKVINPLKKATDIQFIIFESEAEVKPEQIKQLKEAHPRLTILSFNDLKEMGAENSVDPTPPQPEDLCCVMYTSGSTGAPKGVMLKHRNVVAAVTGVDVIVGPYLGPGDGLLTYLPLAHILEFVFENAVLFWGGTMGYGSIRTLSDASVRNCRGDMREFRPTVLVGVPQVWETVKKGIVNKVNGGSFVVRNLFWGALAAKSFLLNNGLPGAGLLDSIVFNKVKDATGGKLRVCMNGGGPIAQQTQRFISLAIVPMINGYGLTETAAMGALCDPLAWTDEALGEIPGCVEVKLVDFPDAGYFSKNNPPQGEVWVRGGSVTEGYLDLEKETKESFTEDGWFKTGDIGEFDSKGYLKIIDRKKNLVKTLNGEYIALEKLESLYRAAPVVANICVYAASDKSKPIAIIYPAEPALKKLAAENGVPEDDLGTLVHNRKLNAVVLRELQAAGRRGGLSGIEIVEGVVMADEEWTPQNGLVTAAQKLNRKGILQRYQKEVDEAYSNGSA